MPKSKLKIYKELASKVEAGHYKSFGQASAVIKRGRASGHLTPKQAEMLLQTATDRFHTDAPQPDTLPFDSKIVPAEQSKPINWQLAVDAVSAYPKEITDQKLDNQLLAIAFKLLNLCIEHKLSREEVYKRLDERLKAGMG